MSCEVSGAAAPYANELLTLLPSHQREHSLPRATPPFADTEPRIGVIHNASARRNLRRPTPLLVDGCTHVVPWSHAELDGALERFAADGVNVLVIDGGDGTIRDVISAARRHFTSHFPRIAIVPSGKTNALANDLGLSPTLTMAEAIEAIHVSGLKERTPLEIRREGGEGSILCGFIFGAGAYVGATRLAQTTHRCGAFNGLAVGLSIIGAVVRTVFGARDGSWRQGEWMRVSAADQPVVDAAQYMLLGSTLTRMPLRIRPFGRPRDGLKLLRIEARPRNLLLSLPAILMGGRDAALSSNGYHRADAEQFRVTLAGDFILDGETFPGGELTLRQGVPMQFVVP